MICPNFSATANVSSWPQGGPDPGVSGIGVCFSILIPLCTPDKIEIDHVKVLIGFPATAYLTLFIAGIYYFVGYVPEEFLNTLDRSVLANWRKPSSSAISWEPTLRTAVLMFSDQQLVTGSALLASGYAQLPSGLSAYHWQMIVYLAWFSSLTHLTTLTILRQYFRENTAARLWRTILMLVMVTMLGIALLPTGDARWSYYGDNSAGLPALCYFKRLVARSQEDRFECDPTATTTMLISLSVLFSGYMTRMINFSKKATAFTKLWIRTKPGRMLKEAAYDSFQRAGRAHARTYWHLKYLIFETVIILARASFELYESTLWEVRVLSMGNLPQFLLASLIPSLQQIVTLASNCPHLGYNAFECYSNSHKQD